jgi:hypothetical protein
MSDAPGAVCSPAVMGGDFEGPIFGLVLFDTSAVSSMEEEAGRPGSSQSAGGDRRCYLNPARSDPDSTMRSSRAASGPGSVPSWAKRRRKPCRSSIWWCRDRSTAEGAVDLGARNQIDMLRSLNAAVDFGLPLPAALQGFTCAIAEVINRNVPATVMVRSDRDACTGQPPTVPVRACRW